MTIELNPEAEAIIQKQLQSGAFAISEEIVERALEFLALEEDWLADSRSQIAVQVQEGRDGAQTDDLDSDRVRANLAEREEAWLAEHRRRRRHCTTHLSAFIGKPHVDAQRVPQ